jgi:MauM/NapG family ferredoxin protein
MNAIKKDNSYIKQECILCMDCVDVCPQGHSKFLFQEQKNAENSLQNQKGITRTQFLVYLAGLGAFMLASSLLFGLVKRKKSSVIRPPAALPEEEFIQRCIRCGNCMKVCPTNVLQPAIVESGFSGIWTPRFDTGIGYCEYKCNLCGKVCPTGAIARLTQEQKMKTKMGLAEINQDICLPWSQGTECIVCEEHCPIAEKAIKTIDKMGKNGTLIKYPIVDPSICVGCAICEFKCPVTPEKAITVSPLV